MSENKTPDKPDSAKTGKSNVVVFPSGAYRRLRTIAHVATTDLEQAISLMADFESDYSGKLSHLARLAGLLSGILITSKNSDCIARILPAIMDKHGHKPEDPRFP